MPDFVDRLSADLARTDSRWKNLAELSGWRTRMCTLLLEALPGIQSTPLLDFQQRIYDLCLTPTQTRLWIIVKGSKLYHPPTNGVPVPWDLNLNLVHAQAIRTSAWKKFLVRLGMTDCPVQTVIDLIYARYRGDIECLRLSLFDCTFHLRYLYSHLSEESSKLLSNNIKLLNHERVFVDLKKTPIYFPEIRDDLSAAELLTSDDGLLGLSVDFLNPAYLLVADKGSESDRLKFRPWLEDVVVVRWAPILCAGQTSLLSAEIRYVAEHRSDRSLGLLKQH